MAGRRAVVSAVMSVVVVLTPACGLIGGGESADSTDWTVLRQTTSVPATVGDPEAPTESAPPGGVEPASPTSDGPASGTLTEDDRKAISVCTAVSEVQSAGMGFWNAYNSDVGGLRAAASRVITAYSRLSDVAGAETQEALTPVLATMSRVTAAPDQESMRQVSGEIMGDVAERITAVLSDLQPTCPGQLKAEDLDQAERVELGGAPPTD